MDYTPDREALAEKQAEVARLLDAFSAEQKSIDPNQARRLIGTFVRLTPPMDPPRVMELLTIHDVGRGGGSTRKPGNLTLSWSGVMDLVADVTLAGAGAIGSPWLMPFAALYIWMKLWKGAEVELTEDDAFVVYSLWTHRNQSNRITEDDAFSKAVALSEKHKRPVLDRDEYARIVSKLISLDCIEVEGGVIWMREWVRLKY